MNLENINHKSQLIIGIPSLFSINFNIIITLNLNQIFLGACKQVVESISNLNSPSPVHLGLLYIQCCY